MTVALRQPPGRSQRARRAVPVERRRAHRPVRRPAATYRRRRALAGVLLAGAVAAAGLLAGSVLTGPGGDPATAAGAGTAQPARAVRARPGDSLWSIAARFRGDIPISRYVEALITANAGTRIEAGQIVRLP
jgi:Tfp pilus assembly protein FimV